MTVASDMSPSMAVGPGLDGEAIRCVAGSRACIALVTRDGLLGGLSRRMTDDLGFDDPDALRGLRLLSLWHPSERAEVERAFASALRGCTKGVEVDLGYATEGRAAPARITFAKGPSGGAILMTMDRLPDA